MTTTATAKTVSFLMSLISERQEAVRQCQPVIDMFQRNGEPTNWSQSDASAAITIVKALPRDPVAVDPAMQARIDALKGNLNNLSVKDAAFAASLIGQFTDRGRLSDNQWGWVDSLARPQSQNTCDPKAGDIVVADGEYYSIVASKRGGLYAMRWTGIDWEYERHYIRTARANGTILTGDALAEWAAAVGRATKHCVFCGKELTDDRSKDAGYGPTCANNYNLPWGVSV